MSNVKNAGTLNHISSNRLENEQNFSLLRFLAAFFILTSKSFNILQKPSQQPALWYNGKNINLSDAGFYIFFTIGGFLVTQSLFNADSLKHFLWKRLLRVIPPLVVANFFCILLGCLITTLPLKEFVFNNETWTYFIKNSTLVSSQYYLPGVFSNLTDHAVNASLQPIAIGVECYLFLLLTAYTIVIRKWLYLSCFILFQVLRIYLTSIHNYEIADLHLRLTFTYGTYFFLGSLLYCFKDLVRFKWFYANMLLAVAFATVYTVFEPVTLSIFLAYCITIIGVSKSAINLKVCDFSYGIYLYAYPMQQLVVSWTGYSINVWVHIAISTILAAIPGYLSWLFVEKPLVRKKHLAIFR